MNPFRLQVRNAPALVWPDEMAPLIQRVAALRDDHHDPRLRSRCALCAAQRAASQAFAVANGWRIRGPFDLERLVHQHGNGLLPTWADPLVFDHRVYFQQPRRGVALLIQPYHALCHDEIPEGVVVDLLPESWWWPGSTSAYVLRPEVLS